MHAAGLTHSVVDPNNVVVDFRYGMVVTLLALGDVREPHLTKESLPPRRMVSEVAQMGNGAAADTFSLAVLI